VAAHERREASHIIARCRRTIVPVVRSRSRLVQLELRVGLDEKVEPPVIREILGATHASGTDATDAARDLEAAVVVQDEDVPTFTELKPIHVTIGVSVREHETRGTTGVVESV